MITRVVARAEELLQDTDEFFLLVPDGENWTYLFVVKNDERKEAFKATLREFENA